MILASKTTCLNGTRGSGMTRSRIANAGLSIETRHLRPRGVVATQLHLRPPGSATSGLSFPRCVIDAMTVASWSRLTGFFRNASNTCGLGSSSFKPRMATMGSVSCIGLLRSFRASSTPSIPGIAMSVTTASSFRASSRLPALRPSGWRQGRGLVPQRRVLRPSSSLPPWRGRVRPTYRVPHGGAGVARRPRRFRRPGFG
jgi:hypothetical protein